MFDSRPRLPQMEFHSKVRLPWISTSIALCMVVLVILGIAGGGRSNSAQWDKANFSKLTNTVTYEALGKEAGAYSRVEVVDKDKKKIVTNSYSKLGVFIAAERSKSFGAALLLGVCGSFFLFAGALLLLYIAPNEWGSFFSDKEEELAGSIPPPDEER